jgi:hypothetical protein
VGETGARLQVSDVRDDGPTKDWLIRGGNADVRITQPIRGMGSVRRTEAAQLLIGTGEVAATGHYQGVLVVGPR